jgi:hypothetical protein
MNSITAVPDVDFRDDAQRPPWAMQQVRPRLRTPRAGLVPPHTFQLDYEEAPRERTGHVDLNRRDAVVGSLPELAFASRSAPNQDSAWTDGELDEAILGLCDEFPRAGMAACSRALEHCRKSTPRGTSQSLVAAMRGHLRRDVESRRAA